VGKKHSIVLNDSDDSVYGRLLTSFEPIPNRGDKDCDSVQEKEKRQKVGLKLVKTGSKADGN